MSDGVVILGVSLEIFHWQSRIIHLGKSKDWDDLVKSLLEISKKPGIERWEDDWDADLNLALRGYQIKKYLEEKEEKGTVTLQFARETGVENVRVAEKIEELSEKYSLPVDFIGSEVSNHIREVLLDNYDFKWTAERKLYWESCSPSRLNYEYMRSLPPQRNRRLSDRAKEGIS